MCFHKASFISEFQKTISWEVKHRTYFKVDEGFLLKQLMNRCFITTIEFPFYFLWINGCGHGHNKFRAISHIKKNAPRKLYIDLLYIFAMLAKTIYFRYTFNVTFILKCFYNAVTIWFYILTGTFLYKICHTYSGNIGYFTSKFFLSLKKMFQILFLCILCHIYVYDRFSFTLNINFYICLYKIISKRSKLYILKRISQNIYSTTCLQ